MSDSNPTDPETVEQDATERLDQDIQVLCSFAVCSIYPNTRLDLSIRKIQMYSRKWYDFLLDQSQEYIISLDSLGKLKRLPPEIRFMIYDQMMPPNSNEAWATDGFRQWARRSAVPRIAHVCRDMRQYAMSKYRLISYEHTVSRLPKQSFLSLQEEERPYLAWNAPVYLKICNFGFFHPKRVFLDITTGAGEALAVAEEGTLEWDDPFQTPTLRNPSISPLRSIGDRIFVFQVTESKLGWSLQEIEWVRHRSLLSLD